MSHFRFIDAEQAVYPITGLCRTIGVSRAGYDAWRRRRVAARAQQDVALTGQIQQIPARRRAT